MIFHFPSFSYYFAQQFDDSFNIYFYNLFLYVIPPNRYFSAALLGEFVTDAMVKMVEDPLLPPSGPRARSLFESPPEPHCLALREALSLSWDYLYDYRVFESEAGERGEYRVNLRVLRGIVQDVRLSEDVKRAERLLDGEFFVSERGLVIKGLRHDGRDIGRYRSARVIKGLEELEYYRRNGNLRTLGREIRSWPGKHAE